MAWNPHSLAVFVVPATGSPVSLVRHDGYPYEENWDEAGSGWAGLFQIANRYLALANARLSLPGQWLSNLATEPDPDSGGFTLHWLRDQTDPRHSYWVTRQGGLDAVPRPTSGPVRDRTAVLLAGLCLSFQDFDPIPLYGGQGLRILVQAGPPAASTPIRITGVCSTLPASVGLPLIQRFSTTMLAERARLVALTYGLKADEVGDVGIRLPSGHSSDDQSTIWIAKTSVPLGYEEGDDEGADDRYETTSRLLVMRMNDQWPHGLQPLRSRPLITSADADVYVQDPVSRLGAHRFTMLRPNRPSSVLDIAKSTVLLGNLPAGAGGNVQLVDPDPDPDFRVTNSRLVDPPLDEKDPKEVAASAHDHVRTNAFAAVNAFFHTSELFRRMRLYGLSPADYFRFVERPVDVRYRAGIVPGFGDGRTVNAQVRWTLRPLVAGKVTKGTIEVRFALGDLESAVGRLPANLPSAVEKSPLGVASDPRWCWHEYCHVLLTAAMGDLEFGFAHSAGDALGAILSDPDSELAKDLSGTLANDGPWRGITFPWVLIPRRHDRAPRDGWGWTGSLYRRELDFAIPPQSDKRGYWAEQILSSSLFRLYRAIGGDSQTLDAAGNPAAARAERQKAADYVAYLIMRTIQSLGASSVAPVMLPDQFVDAMRKVDTATATAPGPGGYVGGAVHKVVQWAFERQGLYAIPGTASAVSGPEEVATVDLHIEDLRPKPEGPYSPVDLLGAAWRADPHFVSVKKAILSRKRKIRVRVQNRGTTAATDTTVEVWLAKVPAGGMPPAFPDATQWTSLASQTDTVPGRTGVKPGAKTFGTFTWLPPTGPTQEYAILATATCEADRSNVDRNTNHPCATLATPINVLVACDNNLGLTTVTVD
jgi:hypothetical protein